MPDKSCGNFSRTLPPRVPLGFVHDFSNVVRQRTMPLFSFTRRYSLNAARNSYSARVGRIA
jgi:hypothetical protein